jgi:hypothetical protein
VRMCPHPSTDKSTCLAFDHGGGVNPPLAGGATF